MSSQPISTAGKVHETPLHKWADRLESVIASGRLFHRAVVLAETDSTQDAARRLHAQPGQIVVAGQQRSGRGRHGRSWSDGANVNLAVTFVLPADRPERLAILSAVAMAEALNECLGHCSEIAALGANESCTTAEESTHGAISNPKPVIGLKWPNDLIAHGRKLAGVLVEQDDSRALMGCGINVLARDWPPPLRESAVSLQEVAAEEADGASSLIDRLAVLLALIRAVESAWNCSDSELAQIWCRFDVLSGQQATFRVDGRDITGRVVGLDPMRGLEVEMDAVPTGHTRCFLPAHATTRLDQ